MMIFSWAQLYVFWQQFFPFKLIRRVQFIRDMRTLMIHTPAKKQLKRIMLEIALGKKFVKQAVFERTQYGHNHFDDRCHL